MAQTATQLPAPREKDTIASRAPARTKGPHRWTFHRVGGLDQVALQDGEDLRHLGELDQKLWVALSCPTHGLEVDARTLELLDTDHDGRVRAPELIAAVKWCEARLVSLDDLVAGADPMPLSAIAAETPDGRAVLGAARQILASLGKGDAASISVAEASDVSKVFENTAFNGDGIVPPESADDVATRQLLVDVVACLGGDADRSGRLGVSKAKLDAFFDACAAHARWWAEGEAAPDVLPFGADTVAAFEALRAVRAKVDDFFARCDLAALDPRAAAVLNRTEPEFAALAAKDLSGAADAAAFPIARAEPGRALPLEAGVNPAWAAPLAAFRAKVVAPLLGADRPALGAAEWRALVARFAAHEAWLGKKEGAAVERLGSSRVRAILAGGKAAVEALLAKDLALEAEAKAVADVERLARHHRDLHTVLRNFVSFVDFYDPARHATFQAGTLFVDGRSCDLCVRVEDPGAHAALAATSRMYIAYCDCRRPGEAMKIAACVTQGDADYLGVGRNGVFYDRKGRDWDATIVKIVDNPISLRQAFWSPYKKFVRLVEEQTARFAAEKAKAADDHVAAAATNVTGAATLQKPPPPAAPVDVGKMVGIIAALGVGVGALGTLLGGFVSGFMDLQPWWAKLVALGGMMLLVSGPAVLVAWLKLRQRTLGPVLDATGWAVNGRVKVNVPLGTALTDRAVLPKGARRSLDDPYADKAARRRRRLFWLAAIVVAAALVAARVQGVWPFGPPPRLW
jgi:hypothetical protein